MTGKSERTKPATTRRPLKAEIREIMAMTNGKDPIVVSRKARAAADIMKATRTMRELDALDRDEDEPLDAAGEQRLRDELLRRLDALAAQIAADEGLEYPDHCRPRFDLP